METVPGPKTAVLDQFGSKFVSGPPLGGATFCPLAVRRGHGCDGPEGDSPSGKADFCVKPSHAPGEVVDYGNSGQNKPNGQLKLGECEGDCDRDSDCKYGLKCFQRNGYTSVPGCKGRGRKDWDYCIKK